MEKHAQYFVVTSGVSLVNAVGTPALVAGPCELRSSATKMAAATLGAYDRGTYDVLKMRVDVVDTFSVAPVVTASFVRS